jgi:hypothetical protein
MLEELALVVFVPIVVVAEAGGACDAAPVGTVSEGAPEVSVAPDPPPPQAAKPAASAADAAAAAIAFPIDGIVNRPAAPSAGRSGGTR